MYVRASNFKSENAISTTYGMISRATKQKSKGKKRLGKIHIARMADNHPLLAAVSAWERKIKKKGKGKGERQSQEREIRQRSLHFTPPPYKLRT